ncbi:hypothetical protein PPUJ13061_15750 [Pseudomonas putida]|nr:hypothetical protein PPUJ13061_15750 [Pseudomonas putida]
MNKLAMLAAMARPMAPDVAVSLNARCAMCAMPASGTKASIEPAAASTADSASRPRMGESTRPSGLRALFIEGAASSRGVDESDMKRAWKAANELVA